MNDAKKYQVWKCRIYVPASAKLPDGFDYPPRIAAERAIEDAGIEVLGCFSGWGDDPKEIEVAVIENRLPREPSAQQPEHYNAKKEPD